jgi:RNA polymerase sigma-70 factor (sigma-E family)
VPNREREFREFFDAEFRPLKRLAYLLTGDWTEAEDLAQEAMVRTYRAWHRIRMRAQPAAYARTVLVNKHRSMLRRAKVEAKHFLARMPDPPPPEGLETDQVVVWQALQKLPAKEREILALRYYEDMPQQEIADIMTIPLGTVKSITHRALKHLRAELGEDFHLLEMVGEEA